MGMEAMELPESFATFSRTGPGVKKKKKKKNVSWINENGMTQ